jgi:hypothetical protein
MAGEPALSVLRGFIDLADRSDDHALPAVLNVYFDRRAGAQTIVRVETHKKKRNKSRIVGRHILA